MAVLNERGEVRAAGGVVVRDAAGTGTGAGGGEAASPKWHPATARAGAGVEVLIVHRPKYDDWSLPKGKVDPGETDEECARREVREETGLECELVEELPVQRYRSPGFPDGKVVRYWLMRVVGGQLTFEHEIDDARWVAPEQAAAMLSYERDAELIAHIH